MSRRSLRLDDGLLDRGLPHASTSFSVGGGNWRSSRSLRSRRSQHHSVSCSESLLLQTPLHSSVQPLHNSSLHSVASDASLLSSLLDESSIQETTLVDSLWGLDQDADPDPKESTVMERSSALIGPDGRCPAHPAQTLSRVYCKDCELHSDNKEPETTHHTSSSSSSSCSSSSLVTRPRPLETSTIYCRDRGGRSRTDVLQLCLDWSVLCVSRAAACCVSALTHTWQVCRSHGVGSGPGGVMSLKDSTSEQKQQQRLRPNGSLRKTAGELSRWLGRRWCHMTTSFLQTGFPVKLLLVLLLVLLPLLLLSLCWFTPDVLPSALPAVNVADSDVVAPATNTFTSSQSQSAEGGEEEEEAAAREESREVQLYEEPSDSERPAAAAETSEEQEEEEEEKEKEEEQQEQEEKEQEESSRLVRLEQRLTALWERVEGGGRRAERRHREVLLLYKELQEQRSRGRSQEEQEQEEQEEQEEWLRGQVDRHLSQLRTRLEQDRQQREQDQLQQQTQSSRLQRLEQQLQSLSEQMEELQRRREAPSPATLPAAVSVAVDRQSHDALLAEVGRLEASLAEVRREVQGLSRLEDESCGQVERLQQTVLVQVSAQVREQVQALLYGNQLTVAGGGGGGAAGGGAAGGGDHALPESESLLQWLSQRYVSGAELQAALASLELRILHNISQQLEQHLEQQVEEQVEQQQRKDLVRRSVLETNGAALTQEDVQLMVTDALRLFSQDRTGQADFALESGGGSVLSTRCSETYQTKAALLSLFGVPLWYFSQSPRVVIQPDVHPGNCWAFRGSSGFLVIRLSMRILPTSFSLEHIPKALAPTGTLLSAPRRFDVYGLEDEGQESGKLLGSYTYDEDGEALQTFAVTEENDETFHIIEVQVLSNWGHPEYTCLYRFRVHGTPPN